MAWIQLTTDELKILCEGVIFTPGTEALQAKILAKMYPSDPELDKEFLETARNNHGSKGGLEFDDEAVVSYGDDNGAYVMGWQWVYFHELPSVKAQEEEIPY